LFLPPELGDQGGWYVSPNLFTDEVLN
jgi:hypothetical protein